MRFLIFILLVLPLAIFAQQTDFNYPKDTSFDVESAFRKIEKQFPHARVVNEFSIPAIQEKRNVVYYWLGKRALHMDIFYPKVAKMEPVPGVLLIHGGGWASGTKAHLVPMAQKLAEAGFVAATVEYRLSPEALYPAGVVDLKTALKWLKLNAGEFGLDTAKVATLGTSAGATLASLLGTTAGNTNFAAHPLQQEANDKVHAVINIDGVVDFTDPNESGKDENPEKPSAGARWFGATYKENPGLWIEASPISYVGKNTPPTIFINSALPRFHAGRESYLAELNKFEIYNEVHTIGHTPHPFWLCHPWFDETVPYIVTFLHKVFD